MIISFLLLYNPFYPIACAVNRVSMALVGIKSTENYTMEVNDMKVKCINKYHDTQLGRLVNPDEELEVTDARATALINARVAEEVTTTPEVVTEPAPKKKAPAKKASK